DVGPTVHYNTERGMRISYPEHGGRRTIREPRFEIVPTERAARVKYRLGMHQEIDCVLRVWAAMLHLPPDGFLFHAAGVITPGGRGYLVCGHSGGGKSTLAGNLIGRPDWHVLSDEMPAVLREKEGWNLCFTPFWGDLEPRMPEVTQAELRGICKLVQGDAVTLKPLGIKDGTALLFESVTSYGHPSWFVDLLLPFVTEVAHRVPAYRLTVPRVFDPDELSKLMDFN
ncbi:hypothetical protein KAU45_08325, partial [bacterium]|nr:hypothetical protein [bacterium]